MNLAPGIIGAFLHLIWYDIRIDKKGNTINWLSFTDTLEQRILDTNVGQQLAQAATDV